MPPSASADSFLSAAFDAFLLWDGTSYPSIVLACRPVGVLCVEQNNAKSSSRERNDRLAMLPLTAPRWASVQTCSTSASGLVQSWSSSLSRRSPSKERIRRFSAGPAPMRRQPSCVNQRADGSERLAADDTDQLPGGDESAAPIVCEAMCANRLNVPIT